MAITVTYKPNKGISFDNLFISWGTDKHEVRQLLNDKFEISDRVIDLSEYNDGDAFQNIIQKRDIFTNFQGQDNLFFLNYDEEDKLRDIEIHHGFDIMVNEKLISFSMDIEKITALLSSISSVKRMLSEGEYFFEELKLTIASSDAIGGDGKKLRYFYCSKDVTHLISN